MFDETLDISDIFLAVISDIILVLRGEMLFLLDFFYSSNSGSFYGSLIYVFAL